MPFDPDEIARLSPAARVEVQDFYARKFLAARDIRLPERRRATGQEVAGPQPVPAAEPGEARAAWPRVWFRNDSSRPTSPVNQLDPPIRPRDNVRIVSRIIP